MPSYNTAEFIGKAIESVIDQTYQNWELLIIDDCSTDNSAEVVNTYRDSRIKFFVNSRNIGAALSRNFALLKAQGKWIAFLDSDDLWLPDKLEKQIAFMEKNNYYFSYTKYYEFDEKGDSLNVFMTGPKKVSSFLMHTFNYMGCLTVMYDRNYVGTIQIKDIPKRNDYAIWIKVAKKCPAYLLAEQLAGYRVRTSGSITNRKKGILDRIKYNYYLWRYAENLNCIKALFLTGINMVFGLIKKVLYKKKM